VKKEGFIKEKRDVALIFTFSSVGCQKAAVVMVKMHPCCSKYL